MKVLQVNPFNGKQRIVDIPDESEVVPEAVTMRQARLALLAAGHLAAVEEAIVGAGPAAQIDWEYATEVRRDSPLVAAIGSELELGEAAKDALFVIAAGI